MESEQHEAPRRRHGGGLVAGEVNVLADVDDEAVGGGWGGEIVVGAAKDGLE